MSHQPITIITSIPPKLSRKDRGLPFGLDYQSLCLKSWIDNGFSIVSVNDASEIESLAPRYSQVTFHAAARNSSLISGKKSPYIVDLLRAGLATTSDIIGICNSDILLEQNAAWQRNLPDLVVNSVVLFQRYDTRSLRHGVLGPFPHGFDVFFFERATAEKLLNERLPYAMGIPWWDYWLPVALAFQGLDVKLLRQPMAMHLSHEQGYNWDIWRRLGRSFTDSVASTSERSQMDSSFRALITICQQIKAENPTTFETIDPWLIKAGDAILDAIYKATILPERNFAPKADIAHTDPPKTNQAADGNSQDQIFNNLTNRTKAAPLLDKAAGLYAEGKFAEAEPIFKAVLEIVPEESDALCCLGRFYNSEGRFSEAVDALEIAARQLPDLSQLLCDLGRALIGTGAHAAAVPHLQKSVALEPDFYDGHYHLAVALNALGRQADATFHSERAKNATLRNLY